MTAFELAALWCIIGAIVTVGADVWEGVPLGKLPLRWRIVEMLGWPVVVMAVIAGDDDLQDDD